MQANTIIQGDALSVLKTLPDASVQCVITSPPYYGLRDYGTPGQIGLEGTPAGYVSKLVEVFREVRRVLKDDGTFWLNLGDSYGTGTKAPRVQGNRGIGMNTQSAQDAVARVGGQAKQLLMIPARVAIALQDDGWYLRSDVIWSKGNPMPESVTDRPTKSHEYLFLFAKNERYYYCADAIREECVTESNVRNRAKESNWTNGALLYPMGKGEREWNHPLGRNKRSVWTVNTQPYPGAHFAVMPPKLVEPCILAGSRPGDIVLDPFSGSGTVAQVAVQTGRQYLGIELNPEYIKLAQKRLANVQVNLWDAMTPTVDTIAAMLPAQAQDDQREEKGA